MKWKIIIIATVLALGAGGTFLFLSLQPNESEAQARPIEVRQGDLVELASASGTIEPDVQIAVKSRASGEVIEVLVSEGDEVEAGDILVRLDPRDAEQAVLEAEMALTRAKADLTQARASLTVTRAQAEESEAQAAVRNRGAELGLISSEDQRSSSSSAEVARTNVTLRQAQVRSSVTNVESAELRVEEAKRRLEEVEIHAPVAGTVLSVEVELGSIVASGITNMNGGTTLMTVADLSDLRVVGAIDEAQVGQVSSGQDVTIRVDAYPTQTFTGLVHRVSPLGQETSNIVTFDVEIMVTDENANLLRSGMSADLDIVTSSYENVALIPVTAVQNRGKRSVVNLASGERRVVKTGATDGASIVVLEGLEPGEILGTGSALGGATKRPEGNATKNKSLLPMGGGRGKRG